LFEVEESKENFEVSLVTPMKHNDQIEDLEENQIEINIL
jgi:hypothetical protein